MQTSQRDLNEREMERGGDGHSPSFRNGSPRIYAEPAIDWYLRAGDVARSV
jgi:hypothetical protein